MHTITPTRTAPVLSIAAEQAWQALRDAALDLARAWSRRQQRRADERALRDLSPWLLRDLGLDPSDIPSIAAAGGSDLTRRHLAHF
jgi:uncharacterized protein YjiS (DUF1127 family)